MFHSIVLSIITILTIISGALILVGPSMCDRLLGFNLMASKITMMIVIYSMIKERTFYLDIALVFSLLGFIGVIFIGNFVKNRGRI